MTALLLALLAFASPQPQGDARAIITVVDQTGAIIQNATVTLSAVDQTGKTIEPVKTGDKGVASFAGLAPGRYNIQAEFPGFETKVLKDIRLRTGDNKHVVVLPIQGLQDSVTVSRDAREAASDRRTTFGTALTREQIDSLSDDPDEMAQQLQDLAGGGAVIRVDSFEGGRLPPKTAIKAIHITRDAFAAENHFAGGLFIDIVTQPGIGPLRTNLNTNLRAGMLSGKQPADISPSPKGPERTQRYAGGIGGSLIKQKASFSVSVNGNTSFTTPFYNFYAPDGTQVNSLAPRVPRDNVFVVGLFDYAVTRDQTVRVQYFEERSKAHNLGIGNFDQLERGYANSSRNHTLRLQEVGPLGRRFFTNTRASINWYDDESHSAFDLPTIIVLENFNSGGRQSKGGANQKTINLQSDLDYVRGMNSVRAGVQLDGGSYFSDASSNYLGTYTFESMRDYENRTPRSFSIRTGDPVIKYDNLQAGMYLQDDIRVRKNLTLSPGVRYEVQTHLSDYNNVGPRFGITWSPGKSGKTTLRGSAGIFYDWLFTNVYEQTLRVDGVRQREVTIPEPPFLLNPTLAAFDLTSGITLPSAKYLLSDGLQMQRNTRFSAGVSRQLTRMLQLSATYAHTVGQDLMRGNNLNAPIDGVRPDPAFSNVIEVVGDARSRADTLNLSAIVNFNAPKAGAAASGAAGGPVMIGGGGMVMVMNGGPPPPPPPPGSRPTPANARWNWHRMSLLGNVFLGRSLNNTDGAFSTPTTGNLADDWGPSAGDIRSRFNINWSSQQLRNFNANIGFNAATAPPYTIRSGFDTNGDLIFNDRPAGVGRNSARGAGQWSMNGFFTYFWQFGKPVTLPGGINFRSDGGALAASAAAAQSAGRYRLSLNVNVQNLTNHANYAGYIGTITSKLFGRPQTVLSTRKVDIGLGLTF